MSYLDWHVGMKVVCVDDDADWTYHAPIKAGQTYTIRSVWPHPYTAEIGVCLREVTNPVHPEAGIEIGYEARRFRPLVARKTDISIFTQMLTGSKQKEPV
jgi:hypothetical protein